MRCLVLNAKQYDFKDDDGRRVSGANLTIVGDQLRGEDQCGLDVIKVACDRDIFRDMSAIPGVYELEVGIRNSGNKAVATVTGQKYIRDADVLGFLNDARPSTASSASAGAATRPLAGAAA